MKAIMTMHNWASDLVSTWWTPVFVLLFLVVVAVCPVAEQQADFEAAAKMPLRED